MANKTLTTRIVSRNDTQANWESVDPILLKGELGVEVDTNRIKVGDGVNHWTALSYIGADTNQIQTLINASEDNFYTVVRNTDESDDAAIARALGEALANKGDIAVIKTALGTEPESYSFMGYVYDGATWGAMDGNVSSDNVIMSQDILLAGSYTQVGNITKTASETKTLEAQGKTMTKVWESIFTKELFPSKPTPSCSVTLTNAGAKEVGETFSPSYTTSFDKKAYAYPPKDTGVTVSAWSVKDSNGVEKTTSTGSFDSFTVGDDTNYKLTATADYSDGLVPKSNLGNDYADSQIKAGTTAAANSSAVTGYRKWFTYVGTSLDTINSAFIREHATSQGAADTSFNVDLTIPDGTKRVFVAIPSSKGKTLSSVIDVDGMGLDVKDNSTKKTVAVEGANGYTAVNYDVFLFENTAGFAPTTYKFSF